MPPDPANSPPESPPAAAAPDPLERRVSELEDELVRTRASLAHSERRRDVDRLLVESGVTDLEAASALLMERIDKLERPDIAGEVRTLKRRKPAFFKRSTTPSSMGGRDADEPPSNPVEAAAKEARAGGRAALLRYMRARRS